MNYKSRLKRSDMIVLIDTEKVFDKIQYTFMIKSLKRLGITRNYLNIIWGIYGNLIADIILNWKKLTFPQKVKWNKSAHSLYSLSMLIKVLEQQDTND